MSWLTKITITFALVGTLAGLVALPASAGAVYRWVDDDGGIHYTAYPPKDRPSEKVMNYKKRSNTTQASSGNTTATAPPTPAEPATSRSAGSGPVKDPDPERCAIARKNLTTLQQNARVRVKGEDGQYRYLTPAEHQDRIKQSQQAINESC